MKIKCPEFDVSCPYVDFWTGNCTMAEEKGCDPTVECDAFFYFIEDELDDLEFEERWEEN